MLVMIFNLIEIAWLVSEVILGLVSRAKSGSATTRDRGSLALLWVSGFFGFGAGNFIRLQYVGAEAVPGTLVISAALVSLLSGLALRWTAILTLRRFYNVKIAIQPGQHVVQSGVYRHVRHPAYSGLLLILFGIGLSFDNWLSLLCMLIPIVVALLYRIHVEEKMLLEMLGRDYVDYRAVTKRLIRGIY